MDAVSLPLILGMSLLGAASPGPTTLMIADTAMQRGRAHALALASGVMLGSLTWSVAAAFSLAAVMLANAWLLEMVRHAGAAYLIYLAFRSARSALRPGPATLHSTAPAPLKSSFAKGLALHLTNPKAALAFGAIYAIGVPPGTQPQDLLVVIAAIGAQSALVFHGYALLFSAAGAARLYARLRRVFESLFAAAFAAAGWKILTARLG
ncbi:LysE family translocator [Roseobacteraceae bacterium NS-SX3]